MHHPPTRPPRRPSSVSAAAVRSDAAPPSPHLATLFVLLALALVALFATAGCRVAEDETTAPSEPTAATSADPEVRASVPSEGYTVFDPERLEAERLDESWRASAERDRRARADQGWTRGVPPPESAGPEASTEGGAGAGTAGSGTAGAGPGGTAGAAATGEGAAGAAAAGAPVERMRRTSPTPVGAEPPIAEERGGESGARPASAGSRAESWDALSPEALRDLQPHFPIARQGGGPTVLALQRLLDRVRFSPGVIDGRWGKNTEKAVYWLQDSVGLEATGLPDRELWDRLVAEVGEGSALRRHRVTSADLAGPFIELPEDVAARAKLECLCYGSAAEALAERFHTTRDLLAKLNPGADLDSLSAGAELWVPDVEQFTKESAKGDRVARIVVSKDGFYLHALDDRGRILYHFPTTVGAGYDPSPSGDFRITATAWDPTFHYQPKLFADVPDSEPEHLLPAGPNSPVGLVWMQLSKDNYGIHGTAAPETIGYSTSHGCIRLTNWDALFVAGRAGKGTPVEFRGGDGDPAAAPSAKTAAGTGG